MTKSFYGFTTFVISVLNSEYAAAEISFDKNRDTDKENYNDGISVTTNIYARDWDQQKEIHFDEIRNRLQHLESELATVLHSLRSKRVDSIPEEVHRNSFSNFVFSFIFTCCCVPI